MLYNNTMKGKLKLERKKKQNKLQYIQFSIIYISPTFPPRAT